jgi:hypothetical protein
MRLSMYRRAKQWWIRRRDRQAAELHAHCVRRDKYPYERYGKYGIPIPNEAEKKRDRERWEAYWGDINPLEIDEDFSYPRRRDREHTKLLRP